MATSFRTVPRKGAGRVRGSTPNDPARSRSGEGSELNDPVSVREIAAFRLVLSDGSCGLAPATRELFARARLSIDEYGGHAMSYSALEEWAELGIGGAILPAAHIRRARSSALEANDKPVTLRYEAVWRKDLLVAQHTKAFVAYLRAVVPRLVQGAATGAL